MPCSDCGEKEFRAMRQRMSDVLFGHDELDGLPVERYEYIGSYKYRREHPELANHNPNQFTTSNKWVEANIDAETARLCSRLRDIDDSRVLSLELQKWWIGHQIQDREREENA